MNRSEFFSEMGKGLFKTVKEVTSPFISEDIDRLDAFVDDLTGLTWYEVGEVKFLGQEGFHDLFLKGNSFAVIYNNHEFKAFRKICPACNTMAQWISYEQKFKCLSCEDEYYVQSESGDLKLKSYPLKVSEGKLYLGVN